MIICSNSWDEACSKLQHATDKDWLRDNGFVLRVKEAMWV